MFTIKNLRKEKSNGWTYLKVDLDVEGMRNPFAQDTIWFAMKNKDADMLTDDVYDAFAPFMLYLGMHFHQDIHIEGEMSPLLYHNLTHYVAAIFNNFSEHAKFINFKVDGFKEAKRNKADLVATGISCGVDSLNTLYSNYVEVEDERFKVNSLFFFNCGQNGYYGEERTRNVWLGRIAIHKNVPKLLGLPSYYIDTNLHAFYTPGASIATLGFMSLFGCILSVQKYVKRYVFANSLSYDEILQYGYAYKNKNLFDYSESYLPHLFSTERTEIVIDGCEYTRNEKLERIKDWDIAMKNLDVCWNPDDEGHNCSKCIKCMRTLLVLDAMGKLDNFKDVFDLEVYRKSRNCGLSQQICLNDAMSKSVLRYLKDHGKFIPPKIYAYVRYFFFRLNRKYHWIKENGTWRDNSKW